MPITKRQIVDAAYEELAMAGWVYDLDPAELAFALRRLEMMMARWESSFLVDIGYTTALNPAEAVLTDDSGITAGNMLAVSMNLALEIARSKGKRLNPATIAAAVDGLNQILNSVPVLPRAMPSDLPLGAGYRSIGGQEYFTGDTSAIGIDPDVLELE